MNVDGASLNSPERASIDHPMAGVWTVLLNGFSINTGTDKFELRIALDGKYVVSSTEALSFDAVPKHLIVVGGGYIGLEMGSVWLRLGSKVTVVEFLPRILPLNDTEIVGLVQKSLTKQGMTFHLGTKVTAAKVEGNKVVVTAQSEKGDQKFVMLLNIDRVLGAEAVVAA